ncbi:lamin tail domain-containing protein [Streptomyces californicus]|uniref:lamin tail domain-containing protein n=1 Tax=Streptomyces californicus TaxID=67351 RepID=UPI00382250F5
MLHPVVQEHPGRVDGDQEGSTGRAQDDEHVEIVNRGAGSAPIGEWVLNAGEVGQDYTFPPNSMLLPGMILRVHTSDQLQPPGWYGLTFHSNRPIWNDKGDTAELRDTTGALRSRYTYGDPT